jgi:hypothetical protein
LPFHSTFLVPTEQKTDPLCSSFLFEPDMGTEPFHDVGMEPFHSILCGSWAKHTLSYLLGIDFNILIGINCSSIISV